MWKLKLIRGLSSKTTKLGKIYWKIIKKTIYILKGNLEELYHLINIKWLNLKYLIATIILI